jgi:hypothetical protein
MGLSAVTITMASKRAYPFLAKKVFFSVFSPGEST